MKGVILAGGRGTRLRPLTHTGPKQLIPVANKPVLQYAIEDLRDAGITEIGIVLGNKGREAIREFVGDGSAFGVDVTYIVQGDPLGLAHAVDCTRAFVGDDDFVVYLGDNLFEQPIARLVEAFERGDYAASLALREVDQPGEYGIARIDDDGNIEALVEKPDDPPSDLAITGLYVFSPELFDVFPAVEPSWRGEFEITDAIGELLARGHRVGYDTVEGWWKDTGRPADVVHANRLLLGEVDGTIADGAGAGAAVREAGTAEIHETAVVEDGATLHGPVSIDANARIGAGATVGPYVSVGANATIDRAEVANSVVMAGATVDTTERIVDSLIGAEATVGDRDAANALVLAEHSEIEL